MVAQHSHAIMCRFTIKTYHFALVAQLDRVSPSEGEGRGFESRRARHSDNNLS